MISRHWRGIVKEPEAESYIAHLRNETFPELSAVPGFHGASILRRAIKEGVEFLIVTRWESIAAIRKFAGENPEVAVVPEKAQAMMVRYDRTVAHYEVVE